MQIISILLVQEKLKEHFIEADRDGNVFYAVKNNEYINNGDLVAVLVDPENKKSDMMKTYIDLKTILFGKK